MKHFLKLNRPNRDYGSMFVLQLSFCAVFGRERMGSLCYSCCRCCCCCYVYVSHRCSSEHVLHTIFHIVVLDPYHSSVGAQRVSHIVVEYVFNRCYEVCLQFAARSLLICTMSTSLSSTLLVT